MRVISRLESAILSVCWGITDAIAQSVEELKLFPNALFHLAEPLELVLS